MNVKVLIATQNAQLFTLLKHILEIEGFSSKLAPNPMELIDFVQIEKPVAVLLDCSSPHMNAHHIYRQIKVASGGETAIAALASTRASAPKSILRAGKSDVVLTRPFNPAILLAFLRGLREGAQRAANNSGDNVHRHGDIEVNVARFRVTRKGSEVPLSALQFRLLLHLIKRPAVIHSRDDLIAAVWPADAEVEPRTVDIHIGHIRRALKNFGPDVIRTVRAVGYSLEAFDAAPNTD